MTARTLLADQLSSPDSDRTDSTTQNFSWSAFLPETLEGGEDLLNRDRLPFLPSHEPGNSKTVLSNQLHPFLLYFRSPSLENEYVTYKYGSRADPFRFIVCVIGGFLMLSLLPFQDLDGVTRTTPVSTYLWSIISRLVVFISWIVTGLSFVVPLGKTIKCRTVFVEITVLLSTLISDFRFSVRDLVVQGFESPYCALKSGVGAVQFSMWFSLNPRIIVTVCSLILSGILFSIMCPVWYFVRFKVSTNIQLPVPSYEVLGSLIGYWWQVAAISVTLWFVSRADRELFLVLRELKMREDGVREACSRTERLLKNVVPESLIPMVMKGELERMGTIVRKKRGGPVTTCLVMNEDEDLFVGDGIDLESSDRSENGTEVTDFTKSMMSRRFDVPVGCIVESLPEAVLVECDIVGFTKWSDQADPNLVLSVVNGYMNLFDLLSMGFRVEKLATAGDSWLGFSLGHTDSASTVSLAIAMIEGVRRFNSLLKEVDGHVVDLRMRVGVAAGQKFHLAVHGSLHSSIFFDGWGDLRNETFQLESLAVPDGINLNPFVAGIVAGQFRLHNESDRSLLLVPGDNWLSCVQNGLIAKQISSVLDGSLARLRAEKMKKGDRVSLRRMSTKYGRFLPVSETRTASQESVADCWPRFWAWLAKKCSAIRCVSRGGLVYPLGLFRKLQVEINCQKDRYSRRGSANSLMFLVPLLLNVVLLVVSATSWPDLFLTANPHLLCIYGVVVVEIIITILLSWFCCHRKSPPYFIYAICFWFHLFVFEAESVLVMLYSPRPIPFRLFLLFNHALILAWDASVASHVRLLLAGIDSIIFVVDVSFVNYLDFTTLFELLGMLLAFWFVCLVLLYGKDLQIKRVFDSRNTIAERTERIVLEKSKAESLLDSLLPGPVLKLLQRLHGRSFASRMNQLPVCFLKITNLENISETFQKSPNVGDLLETTPEFRHVRAMVMFLTSAFHEFDSIVQSDSSCVVVKRFQDSYMFISRIGGGEGVAHCLNVFHECIGAFQRTIRWWHVSRRRLAQAEEEDIVPQVQLGLSCGQYVAQFWLTIAVSIVVCLVEGGSHLISSEGR